MDERRKILEKNMKEVTGRIMLSEQKLVKVSLLSKKFSYFSSTLDKIRFKNKFLKCLKN